MKIAIDSGVKMAVAAVKVKINQGNNASVNFWQMHAQYWAERGEHHKAEDCRREAHKARGFRDDD